MDSVTRTLIQKGNRLKKTTPQSWTPGSNMTFILIIFCTLEWLAVSPNARGFTSTDKKTGQESFTWNFAGFPALFYTPETSFIAGGGGVFTFRRPEDDSTERPDSISGFTIYSLKSQYILSVTPDFYFYDDVYEARIQLSYQKYPDSFFGLGPEVREEDEEEFTTEDVTVQPWLLASVFRHLRVGLIYDFKKTDVLKVEKDGLLESGEWRGAEGSVLSGVGPALSWDSRDNTFSPHSGSWLQLYGTYYREETGSEFECEKTGQMV